MGNKPSYLLCQEIDDSKWYICECGIFYGGDPLTGCSRPYMGTEHEVVHGWSVKRWVCDELNCTEGEILITGFGDAQILLKIFGPWDTVEEAWEHMW